MPLISRMYSKGVPSLSKNNNIKNGKGLDLGAEPSRVSTHEANRPFLLKNFLSFQ